jgi:hypothetical protein
VTSSVRMKEGEGTVRALRRRSKSQPPPAWAIYEALSDPIADQARREWLDLHDGELPPRIVQAVFPSLVVWASLWPDRPDDQIRFDIEDQRLTWTLMGEASDADEERLDQLRYRLDVMINAGLRISFGN